MRTSGSQYFRTVEIEIERGTEVLTSGGALDGKMGTRANVIEMTFGNVWPSRLVAEDERDNQGEGRG